MSSDTELVSASETAKEPKKLNWGVVAPAFLVLLVVMGELSRLSGEILDRNGRSWAFAPLMGSGRLLAPFTDGWSSVFDSQQQDRMVWLLAYIALDLTFIWLYGYLVARHFNESWHQLSEALRWLAVVDIAEDVLALTAGAFAAPAAPFLSRAVGLFSMLKWILVIVVLVIVARRALGADRARIKVWLIALYHQRFSILVVLPLALLSIPSGSDLLDQLPDVQRRWLRDGQGGLNAVFAALAVVVVTAGIFTLGRLRSGEMWHRSDESVAEQERAPLWLGLIPVAVIAVGMIWIWVQGSGTPLQMPGLNPARVAAFLALPVVIMGGSGLIRWALTAMHRPGGTDKWFKPIPHRVPTPQEKRAIIVAGDILAVSAVVIGGLGLVRSMTPIVALEGVGLVARSWLATIALAVGVVVSLFAWQGCSRVFDLVATGRTSSAAKDLPPERNANAPGEYEAQLRKWYRGKTLWERVHVVLTPSSPMPARMEVRVGVITLGILMFFAVGAAPSWFGDTVGVIGTALLAFLALSLILGGTVVALQDRFAPELFWFRWIRLSSLPLATLLVAVVALTSMIGSNIDVHGVRGLASGTAPALDPTTRPTLTEAIDDWARATAGCGHVETIGKQQYRLHPMFFFAAEGGGIRAAYWTAASLDLLRGVAAPDKGGKTISWDTRSPENPCARALFSGGASGGAVGLTVARFAGPSSARDRVVAMAGPDALGAATAGLLIRDMAYSATGVPFFGQPGNAANRVKAATWLDRGGLIEKSWESTAGLSVPFLPADTHSAAASVTGALILNSTRVSDGCRMWVSQLGLAGKSAGDCDSATMPSGHTVDLFASMANAVPGRVVREGDQCLGPITAATGALLSSRFPFVTPSGVIGPCNGQPEQQLVDGGYVENTGLATVVDLAPSWLQEVRKRNTLALKGNAPIKDVIVPVVMYLDNGTGGDLVKDPPSPTSELFVPTTTTGRAKTALIDTPALLRNAERIILTPHLFDAGSEANPQLVNAIDRWRKEPVVVVHQSTFPAVTAPLGWVLSQESIQTMDRALAQQSGTNEKAGAVEAITSHGSLSDALGLVRPDPK